MKNKYLIWMIFLFLIVSPLNSQGIRVGSTSDDIITGVASDQDGNIFIIGYTFSGTFPTTKNSHDSTYNGGADIFLCKFDKSLKKLLASTYIGGLKKDQSGNLLIDKNGDILVSGYTESKILDKTINGFDSSLGGKSDHFILKISNDLKKIKAFTFLGGSSTEGAFFFNITLDSASNVLMSGITNSKDFPITKDAYDKEIEGPNDLYIAKLSPNLKTLLSSTFLGGNQWEAISGIKVNHKGKIFVGGHTASTNFPCTPKAFDKTYDKVRDIFVSRFDSNLSKLESSTLIPGNEYDCGYCWNLDHKGNIMIGGMTCSTDYYTTKDAFSRKISKESEADINLTILEPNLSEVLSSTLLGGSGAADDVISLNNGRVIIVGRSFGEIKTINAGQEYQYHGGASDGFIAVLDSTLKKCLFLGYIGGEKYDDNNRVILLPNHKILVVGTMQSQQIKGWNFVKTFGSAGGADIYLKVIDLNLVIKD